MRLSRCFAPAALFSLLALTGCDDGAPATTTGEATPSATTASAPATSPVPTPSDAVMPDLHDRTYRQAEQDLADQDLPTARITATARHKDVTLPTNHDTWRVCDTSPRPGASVTADTTVVLKLAEQASYCEISFHGYLHQRNDPAYTPPQTSTPKPTPTRAPAPATTTSKPAGSSLITCPDGKQGYACTSNGHPVVDGQFCPKADHGRTLKATNGTTVTCSYDPSITPYRWQ